MKRKMSILLAVSLIMCFGLQLLAGETSKEVTAVSAISKIDPMQQRYDSAYLTNELKEKYDFNFEYGSTYETLQLPDSFLKNATTEELAVAVFAHPETFAITYYSDREDGFESIYNRFNGLRELLDRKDVASVVSNLFLNMKPFSRSAKFSDALLCNFTFELCLEEAMGLSAFSSIFNEKETELIQNRLKENILHRTMEREDEIVLNNSAKHNIEVEFTFDGTKLVSVCIPNYETHAQLLSEGNVQTRYDDWDGKYANIHGELLRIRTSTNYGRTKGGIYYDVLFYLDDIQQTTRQSLDAQTYQTYSMQPIYKKYGNYSATAFYNCNGYGWCNSHDYNLELLESRIIRTDTAHAVVRATSTNLLNDDNFYSRIRVGDVLVPETGIDSHSSRITGKSVGRIQVREKWDTRGEYQYFLGAYTPWYTPSDTSPPPPYRPTRAYQLK